MNPRRIFVHIVWKAKFKLSKQSKASIFWKHYEEQKNAELCLLPPCYRNFEFHLRISIHNRIYSNMVIGRRH